MKRCPECGDYHLNPDTPLCTACEDAEDAKDLAIAEKRLANIRAGRTKTIPLEEVMKQYGLECDAAECRRQSQLAVGADMADKDTLRFMDDALEDVDGWTE